ncbi:MAG: threonine synthase [Saprospiraceae bacterium]|nr:threonine synthase [Saprospiraceae bacterium]
MQLYSTNNRAAKVYLKEAVMQSLAPDKGLYMPISIPLLHKDFLKHLDSFSFQEIAFEVSKNLIGDYIPHHDMRDIVTSAINFPAPIVMLNEHIASLELWHGPSLAFKAFGARFMASLMSYFIKDENKTITILVATSGDTGGAVAAGFYKTPGVEVIILYPSGKVSELQEKQLTTLGKNIKAIEVMGTFDDCQALVKQAFLDNELNRKYRLSSANSINIARLIPQSFYFFEAYKQVMKYNKDVVFSVPSGNFGNLTAGLLAKKMGLPVKHFIASTNINKIVPHYLQTGIFDPKPSISTISNAMDVGNPSNFTRILNLYDDNLQAIRHDVSGFYLNDEDTKKSMISAYQKYNYVCDPHGAIAYKSLENLKSSELGIFLETAHPAKFIDVVEQTLKIKIEVPASLSSLADKEKIAHKLSADFEDFKAFLMEA